MKETVIEIVESKTALDRDMYCANCGSHGYEIHYILDPQDTSNAWYIECEGCGHQVASITRFLAIKAWKRDNGNEVRKGIFR